MGDAGHAHDAGLVLGDGAGRHIHKQSRFNVQSLPGGGERRRVSVADPLQIVQAVQAEIGLRVQAAVRHDSRDHVEVEGIVGQVKFKEALGLVGGDRNWVRFRIVGAPDGIESSSSPVAGQRRQRTEIQGGGDRPLLVPRRYVRARVFKRAGRT